METSAARPTQYVIRGGLEGKRRLELLSRIMWPTTFRLLKSSGLKHGMTALDLGCGGGDATRGIARIVGSAGHAVGIDMDQVKLEQARDEAARHGLSHVDFRAGNVYEWSESCVYDRIYSRFRSPTSRTARRPWRACGRRSNPEAA